MLKEKRGSVRIWILSIILVDNIFLELKNRNQIGTEQELKQEPNGYQIFVI